MFKPILRLCAPKTCDTRSCLHTRIGIFKRVAAYIFGHRTQIPYSHVIQIGDPVLRTPTKPVDLDRINSPDIKRLLLNMKRVIDKHGAMGISAPQLGMALSIFAIQCTGDQIEQLERREKALTHSRGMSEIPFRVFINPKMKIVAAAEQVTHREGCCSLNEYSALVPRCREVIVSGHNERGDPVTFHAKDWAARIVQHEMDHLEGKLFVDKMSAQSLEFNYWNLVNIREGDFRLSFGGVPGWKQYKWPMLLIVVVSIQSVMFMGLV